MKSIEIMVDIEHDGPIPGKFSMVELGAQIVWRPEMPPFHVVIEHLPQATFNPDTQRFLDNVGLTREFVRENGTMPKIAMQQFRAWIRQFTQSHHQPILIHDGGEDWTFVNWYFHYFLQHNPFGRKRFNYLTYFDGALDSMRFSNNDKKALFKELKSDLPHTHRAHEDAMSAAATYCNYKKWLQEVLRATR